MAIDITPIVIIGAGLGGALSSVVGYFSSSESFDGRKFAAGVIRGTFTGLLVLWVLISNSSTVIIIADDNTLTISELFTEMPNIAFLIALLSGYVGDNILNKVSGMLVGRGGGVGGGRKGV